LAAAPNKNRCIYYKNVSVSVSQCSGSTAGEPTPRWGLNKQQHKDNEVIVEPLIHLSGWNWRVKPTLTSGGIYLQWIHFNRQLAGAGTVSLGVWETPPSGRRARSARLRLRTSRLKESQISARETNPERPPEAKCGPSSVGKCAAGSSAGPRGAEPGNQ